MKQAFFKKNFFFGLLGLILAGYCLVWLKVIFAGEFSDERENFVAGWFVSQGLVPYKDFFFHHAPLPFFIAAVAGWLQASFWFLLRIFIFFWWSVMLALTLKYVDRKMYLASMLSWLFSALSSVYFLTHMFLAESLVIPVLLSLICMLLSANLHATKNTTQFFWIFFIAGWVAIWSTIVSILPLAVIGVAAVMVYKSSLSYSALVRPVLTGVILHGLVFAYFLLQGALPDAWWGIVAYNLDYYYPLRLADTAMQAERGFLFGMIERFFSDFYNDWATILQNTYIALQTIFGLVRASVQGLNISANDWLIIPTEWWAKTATPSLLSSWILGLAVFILLIRKRWMVAIFTMFFFISLKSRDNEVFKIGMFVLPVILVGLLVLTEQWLKKNKAGSIALMIPLILMFGLIVTTFLSSNRLSSSIIPPEVVSQAQYLESELPPDTKIVIIGGIPDQYLFTRRLPAHKYYYYHQWFHDVSQIRLEVSSFVENNQQHPIVLQSELNNQPLGFADDLENEIRQTYDQSNSAIYLPKSK